MSGWTVAQVRWSIAEWNDDLLYLSQVAGDQAAQFEGWYKKIDPSGSGTIQAGPAAGFLKKSGLNDNVLSRVSAALSSKGVLCLACENILNNIKIVLFIDILHVCFLFCRITFNYLQFYLDRYYILFT